MKKLTVILILTILVVGCDKKTGKSYSEDISEIGADMQIYFCPRENCSRALFRALNAGEKSIHCAFYDVKIDEIIGILDKKSDVIDVKLVTDSETFKNQTRGIPTVLDDDNQLTHNKFCIIDEYVVVAGSFNPTKNQNTKDNNNLIIIGSKYLAGNYEDEFTELWASQFGEGNTVKYPRIKYNDFLIENYFCPEDKCRDHVIEEISRAKNSIYFMIFAFTDEKVADAILYSNVSDIKGVMDKMQASQRYSQFQRMKEFGINVKVENSTGLLHHKVFIIDNSTVITGSYNPTWAADNKNDENILIIHDRKIAEEYLEEFIAIS
jgi:phospholipase D